MTHITLLTGSTLGSAEYVAEHLGEQLEQDQHNIDIVYHPDLNELDLNGHWLIVCSTHGAGDFPDNFQNFVSQIQDQKPDLSNLKIAVVGLGDSNYDTFCAAGKNIEAMLLELGATSLAERLDIDVSVDPVPEDPAEIWLNHWKSSL